MYDSNLTRQLFPVSPVSPVWATEHGLVLTDRAHTEAIAAAAVVHVATVRIEAEAPRIGRVVGAERPRPVVAVGAGVAELRVPTAAGSGQEERLSVLLRGELPAFHAVLRRPLVGRVRQQLVPLRLAWRAPAAAPVGSGRVVARLQGRLVVGEAIVAVATAIAVLRQFVGCTIGVLVCISVVSFLRCR